MTKFRNEAPTDIDYRLSKKIYLIFLAFSLLWMTLIFLAPVFSQSGGVFERISDFIYIFYSKVCHQQDSRSFHVANHNLAVCSRCVWIYGGFLTGVILYPWKYKLNNIKPPSLLFLIAPFVLLLLDVVFDEFGIFSNTFFSRSLTGFLTGLALPFFIIPGFVKFFYEVTTFLRNKVSI